MYVVRVSAGLCMYVLYSNIKVLGIKLSTSVALLFLVNMFFYLETEHEYVLRRLLNMNDAMVQLQN